MLIADAYSSTEGESERRWKRTVPPTLDRPAPRNENDTRTKSLHCPGSSTIARPPISTVAAFADRSTKIFIGSVSFAESFLNGFSGPTSAVSMRPSHSRIGTIFFSPSASLGGFVVHRVHWP
jgi:hypothetical protein